MRHAVNTFDFQGDNDMKQKDWLASVAGGIILGVAIVALQVFGYLPQATNVQAAGEIEKVLTKTLQSHKKWSSFQGEAQLTQYDADNNPHIDLITIEVEQPLKANVAFKASDDKVKTNNKWVSDGVKIFRIDDKNLSYAESNIPGFAMKLDFIPQSFADVKKDEVYHHPFEMLLSNPIMEYVYPVWFAQGRSGSKYQLLGEETVAGRTTSKVELLTETDHVIAWIDQGTGVILKYFQESDGQTIVEMEFIWVQFNKKIDNQKFSAPDKTKYRQSENQ